MALLQAVCHSGVATAQFACSVGLLAALIFAHHPNTQTNPRLHPNNTNTNRCTSPRRRRCTATSPTSARRARSCKQQQQPDAAAAEAAAVVAVRDALYCHPPHPRLPSNLSKCSPFDGRSSSCGLTRSGAAMLLAVWRNQSCGAGGGGGVLSTSCSSVVHPLLLSLQMMLPAAAGAGVVAGSFLGLLGPPPPPPCWSVLLLSLVVTPCWRRCNSSCSFFPVPGLSGLKEKMHQDN